MVCLNLREGFQLLELKGLVCDINLDLRINIAYKGVSRAQVTWRQLLY
jgi:hypothetical protein